MKTLIIVESPNKIKKIKEVLGEDYDIVASYGHIKDLSKTNGIGIDINNNFKPNYILLPDKLEVIDKIIDVAAKVDEILLCSDFDREGEKIAIDIESVLKSVGKPCFRAVFNEITKIGIERGIREKHAIDLNVVKAQEARRILDRIVGFTVSPMLMNFWNQNSLSAGRVQSVATSLIVNREFEINSFKPEEYWVCNNKFANDKNQQFIAKYDGKLQNKEQADKLLKFIQTNMAFIVAKIQAKQQKDKPPPPLITASLQQMMAKRGFDPEYTMKIAQNLYENGMITYLRTDSVRASDDAIDAARLWIKENNFDLPKVKFKYESKNGQRAHECIRPTDINATPDKAYITGDDKIVYDVIWKYFVASQMQPAVFNTLNVKIVNKTDNKIVFKSSGKSLHSKGYLEIFGEVDAGKIDIPALTENEEVLMIDVKIEQKHTQPPPRYNDTMLLKELEAKQIGRPATFAEIIKKISNRNYVEKQGNTYRPTQLGNDITNYLTSMFSFMDVNFTGRVEQALDLIAEGKMTHTKVLKQFYEVFSKELFSAYKMKLGNDTLCKKCNQNMLERTGKFGRFYACVNPACRALENIKEVA